MVKIYSIFQYLICLAIFSKETIHIFYFFLIWTFIYTQYRSGPTLLQIEPQLYLRVYLWFTLGLIFLKSWVHSGSTLRLLVGCLRFTRECVFGSTVCTELWSRPVFLSLVTILLPVIPTNCIFRIHMYMQVLLSGVYFWSGDTLCVLSGFTLGPL